MKKTPIKSIARLLAKSIRESERGKRHFQTGGDALDQALALGAPIGEPIALRGVVPSEDKRSLVYVGGKVETKVVLRDHLKGGNSGYTNARFARFRVERFTEPKPTPRAAKKPAGEPEGCAS